MPSPKPKAKPATPTPALSANPYYYYYYFVFFLLGCHVLCCARASRKGWTRAREARLEASQVFLFATAGFISLPSAMTVY